MDNENKKTILLVEDEVIIAMSEKTELEKYGYIVKHVVTGEKAVQVILENMFPVNLILMDFDLGSGIDGAEAAKEILKVQDIPIVFLSSHTEPEIVEKTEKITSYGYVVKKSGIVVLNTSIKTALKLFDAKQQLELNKDKIIESEQKYRDLSDSTPDFIYSLDLDSRYTMVNDSVCKAMKLDSKDIIGKNHIELGFPKEIADEWRRLHLNVINKGEVVNRETKTPMPDGTFQIHDITLSPIYNKEGTITGIRGISRDITQRKKTEEALKYEQDLSFDLIKFNPFGIYRVRIFPPNKWQEGAWESSAKAPYTIEIVSDRFCEILGVTKEAYAANPGILNDLVHPLDKASFTQAHEDIMSDPKVFSWDGRIVSNGNTRWVHFESLPRVQENGDVIWTGSVQDITEKKLAEEEIKKQLKEKEILLREVHHRVKNNIANIEALLILQADSNENAQVKTALQDAISRVQSIRVLYDKLLLSQDYRDISMKNYMENMIDSLLVVYFLNSNISIEKNITDFMLISKKAMSIGIIINELLTNIFKYAFKNRDRGIVSISITKNENVATLTIQDNGNGFNKNTGSPGFGLTIVSMLVEQLKGTYSITNENGTKSVIQFEI